MDKHIATEDIGQWLIREGRLLGDGVQLIEQLAHRLVSAGVPLWRLRVAQRFANPLIAAWGAIWRSDDEKTEEYVVARQLLNTDVWIGSPFQYVTENRRSLQQTLRNLKTGIEHHVYYELAEAGGTDFYAMPLEYGDGSVQGMSLVSNHPDGFTKDHIAIMESIRDPLAAVMEPLAARRSLGSLLKTYLGEGPSSAVSEGAIRRGDVTRLNAVIMVTDMRDFTAKSRTWTDDLLLKTLGEYFEIVVQAVHKHGGDVLKFVGDGVLAVFPVTPKCDPPAKVTDALMAVREARDALAKLNANYKAEGIETVEFGTSLHLGEVIYGNVGSEDRLDFTVIGDAVNVASRIEGITKTTGNPLLCTRAIADLAKEKLVSIGVHDIRGIEEKIELFMWPDIKTS